MSDNTKIFIEIGLVLGSIALLYGVVRACIVLFSPVIRSIRRDLQYPSHLLYLLLFAFGAWNSADIVFRSVTGTMQGDALRFLVALALLLFFSSNLLHQYLIYRSCISAEIPGSEGIRDYAGWWVGRPVERIIRFIILLLLLTVSGEFVFSKADLRIISIANCALFTLFLFWNLLAMKRLAVAVFVVPEVRAMEAEIRTRLKGAAWLNLVAVALWGAFALDAIAMVVLMAFMYSFLLATTHIFKERVWHRAYVVMIAAALLLYVHWELFNGPRVSATVLEAVH